MSSEISLNDTTNITIIDGISSPLSNTSNATLSSEKYIPHTERPEYYIVPIVFTLIFVIGVLGNGALIFFFVRYPQMRNPPNTYILSLALGDLLVIIFGVPFVSVIYTTRDWLFGEIICSLQMTVSDLSVSVTVITLTALSAERYLAIVDPVNRRASTRQSALVSIIIIWFISILFALPTALFSGIRNFPTSDGGEVAVCFPFPEWLGETYPKIVVLFKMLLLYAIPLIIIAIFYCLMARHLFSTTVALPGEAFHQRHRVIQMAARRKVAKMVLAFVFIFAICFLPNHVFLMWFYYNPNAIADFNNFWNALRIIGFCLSFINSCINPVALYCISGTFRKYFNYHLFCGLCGAGNQERSLSRLRYYSSAAVITSRTDHFDMSTLNGPEKIHFKAYQ